MFRSQGFEQQHPAFVSFKPAIFDAAVLVCESGQENEFIGRPSTEGYDWNDHDGACRCSIDRPCTGGALLRENGAEGPLDA